MAHLEGRVGREEVGRAGKAAMGTAGVGMVGGEVVEVGVVLGWTCR
jgi:hypothetical protein